MQIIAVPERRNADCSGVRKKKVMQFVAVAERSNTFLEIPLRNN
jgi:hypothetical protein